MKQATHNRKGHTINELITGRILDYKSRNKAKKASRKIQLEADGALGRGSVRRIEAAQLPYVAPVVARSQPNG